MQKRNYTQPTVRITPLEGEVVVSTSVFENGDHVTQPDDSWSTPMPKDTWTGWF